MADNTPYQNLMRMGQFASQLQPTPNQSPANSNESLSSVYSFQSGIQTNIVQAAPSTPNRAPLVPAPSTPVLGPTNHTSFDPRLPSEWRQAADAINMDDPSIPDGMEITIAPYVSVQNIAYTASSQALPLNRRNAVRSRPQPQGQGTAPLTIQIYPAVHTSPHLASIAPVQRSNTTSTLRTPSPSTQPQPKGKLRRTVSAATTTLLNRLTRRPTAPPSPEPIITSPDVDSVQNTLIEYCYPLQGRRRRAVVGHAEAAASPGVHETFLSLSTPHSARPGGAYHPAGSLAPHPRNAGEGEPRFGWFEEHRPQRVQIPMQRNASHSARVRVVGNAHRNTTFEDFMYLTDSSSEHSGDHLPPPPSPPRQTGGPPPPPSREAPPAPVHAGLLLTGLNEAEFWGESDASSERVRIDTVVPARVRMPLDDDMEDDATLRENILRINPVVPSRVRMPLDDDMTDVTDDTHGRARAGAIWQYIDAESGRGDSPPSGDVSDGANV